MASPTRLGRIDARPHRPDSRPASIRPIPPAPLPPHRVGARFVAVLLAGVMLWATAFNATAAPASAAPNEALSFEDISRLEGLTVDHATVLRLYWAYFDRRPDAAGALYWLEVYERCTPLESIVESFAASEEFRLTYGDLDPAGFLSVLYDNVLDRTADAEGLQYWVDEMTAGRINRADAVLYFSLSAEFIADHRLPSDSVPRRPCGLGSTQPITNRTTDFTASAPVAAAEGVTLVAPSRMVEFIGYHQSANRGAFALTPVATPSIGQTTMASRGRGTPARSAADIALHPLLPVLSPVSGTIVRAEPYQLYCRYIDHVVLIAPDARPDLVVRVLHVNGVSVQPGQRVTAGHSVIAPRPRVLPFASQIDRFTGSPAWPHVHLEISDPRRAETPGTGGGC